MAGDVSWAWPCLTQPGSLSHVTPLPPRQTAGVSTTDILTGPVLASFSAWKVFGVSQPIIKTSFNTFKMSGMTKNR